MFRSYLENEVDITMHFAEKTITQDDQIQNTATITRGSQKTEW